MDTHFRITVIVNFFDLIRKRLIIQSLDSLSFESKYFNF